MASTKKNFQLLGSDEEIELGTHIPTAEYASTGTTSTTSVQGSNDSSVVLMFKKSSHPIAALFHVAFKIAALTLYIFGSLFSNSFVVIFVLCVLFLSFDFWTVKNITGRLMVGLRWWNDITDDGQNQWRYESSPNSDSVSAGDYAIFWYSMYLNVILWVVFAFFGLIKFSLDWLMLDFVAISLGCANIYGYWQCSKDAKRKLQEAVGGAIQQRAMDSLASSLSSGFSNMFSGSGGNGAQQ